MRKLFLLLFIMPFVFASCSSDEDDISLTKEDVIGIWDVSVANGESIPDGAIQIQLKSDNSYSVKFLTNNYIGTYIVDGNTVIGTTLDPVTEYFKFESLDKKNATISYSNSEGDKYVFKATKK